MTRGHGPLYEEGMDLDVVDVGDEECPRSGAKHHGATRPLRFNSLSARSTVATSVSLKTESRMGSPATAVHVPTFLTVHGPRSVLEDHELPPRRGQPEPGPPPMLL